MEYIAFVLLCFAASFISATLGFGTSLIVLAVGSYILPVKEVIALATILFLTSTLTKTLLFRKEIDWKVAIIMSLSSLPFAFIGAILLNELPAETLKHLLGLMVLIYLALSVFKLFPKLEINTSGLMMGSAIYGFVSGLLGSGNLIKVIIFREMNISKEAFVGAMAATSVLSNIAKLTAYTKTDILTAELLWPGVSLVLCALIVAFAGRFFLKKVTVTQFGYAVQIVLAICAVGLFF